MRSMFTDGARSFLRVAIGLLLASNVLAEDPPAPENVQEVTPSPKAEDVPAPRKRRSRVKAAAAVDKPAVMDPRVGHARTHFRRHQYRLALQWLPEDLADRDALWIKAESHFRLKQYKEAGAFFEQLYAESQDTLEKRKAAVRLFDVAISSNDTQDAINRYVAFGKEFKRTPAQMRYVLGKVLYDAGYNDRAEKILRGVTKGSEYYIRARYIVASIGLDKRKAAASAKFFKLIEDAKPVSVEDASVHQLAILAQGRIYVQSGREDLAEKAYMRVSLSSPFGETATIEWARAMIERAERARTGEGRFQKMSPYRRSLVEAAAVESAQRAIARYRDVAEIDWRKPELLTVMASVFVESRRYDEARLAYEELINHFRPIQERLADTTTEYGMLPYFALDFARSRSSRSSLSLVVGVPESMVHEMKDIKDILAVRRRIEEAEENLRVLEDRAAELSQKSIDQVHGQRMTQEAIVIAYNQMVMNKQKKISARIATMLNDTIAEAEFKRAELVISEMRDLKTQQKAITDYQSEKIDRFEKTLQEIDSGGST